MLFFFCYILIAFIVSSLLAILFKNVESLGAQDDWAFYAVFVGSMWPLSCMIGAIMFVGWMFYIGVQRIANSFTIEVKKDK